VTEIRFYRANEKPFGAFSNLYRRGMTFDVDYGGGRMLPLPFYCAEQAYQWHKPRKPKVRDWLMAAPSPALLAMAAHALLPWDIAPGWSRTKVDRMRAVLLAKFTQHDDLRRLLLSTADARIVEAGTVDNEVNRFWGEVNGRGKNTLGALLMEVRGALRDEAPTV
jgi:ribA/ribD-fused uncharacterized protein